MLRGVAKRSFKIVKATWKGDLATIPGSKLVGQEVTIRKSATNLNRKTIPFIPNVNWQVHDLKFINNFTHPALYL